ncbi:hypothetical protein ACIBEJ_06590 [Nonomuraea sp. NPDC050790]|uniref:hypothetical protein n=1 Tax=Nonomuraea sp. NPDC050790 TaxID=3364371 RepID=UPI003799D800
MTEHFEVLDRDFFATQGKDWRYLVAWQYAIDSHLRLGQTGRFETELNHLVRAYLNYSDDPDELLPRPGLLTRLEDDLRNGRVEALRAPAAASCADVLHEQLELLVPGGWIR